jgi:phosphate:Na+ symporter
MALGMHPLIQTLGGIGLFLYGMAAMTSGLRKLAGDRLRGWLRRGTHSPLSGEETGTAATAILQSSSATTVAAVGFVAAELLTFRQALGIIFGANIGTTLTGWMVALIGFKLKLSVVVAHDLSRLADCGVCEQGE